MDVHAYRASDELAAALRDYRDRDREFSVAIHEHDRAHPGCELLWRRSPFSADQMVAGFADPGGPVPEGLSRAKSRKELRPVRGAAGKPWRTVLARMVRRPRVELVLREFDVRAHGDGPGTGTGGYYVAPTLWVDAGVDGVLVVCEFDIGVDRNGEPDLSPHLTPMRLSEFYAIKERLEAERATAAQAAAP